MFGWCQEVSMLADKKETSLFQGNQQPYTNRIIRKLIPPRIGIPSWNTIHVITTQKTSKKGIKVHKDEIRRQRNSQNIPSIVINLNKNLIDSATQTPKLMPIVRSKSRNQNGQEYANVLEEGNCKSKMQCLGNPYSQLNALRDQIESQRRKSVDEARLQSNKQTRSTNFHFQNVSEGIRNKLQSSRDVRNIDSFHEKVHGCDKNGFQFSIYPNQPFRCDQKEERRVDTEILMKKQYNFHTKLKQNNLNAQQINSGQWNRNYHMINVSSDFNKASEKKKNDYNRFKLTPQKRAMLMDRDTIVSKSYYEPMNSEKSLRVEESMIFQPEIMSQFEPIGAYFNGYFNQFRFYLAKQNSINLLVSLKEVSTNTNMAEISEQNLIYKQIEAGKFKSEGILSLYQTHIDKNIYIFVKQPYEYILASYLSKFKTKVGIMEVKDIIQQIGNIVKTLQNQGLYLRRYIHTEDIVTICGIFKIHSVNVFKIGFQHSFSISEALNQLELEIVSYLN